MSKARPAVPMMVLFTGLALSACAKDPTEGKTKAAVAPAAAEKTTAAGAEKIAVTPNPSTVGFLAAKVTAQHHGVFSDWSGAIDLIDGDATKSRIELTVQATSVKIDDGEPKLENHLRSPDFFDVEKFPTATFVSTEIARDGEAYKVTGNLELHGVKKSVTFPATIGVTKDSVTVTAEFGVNRKDFGIEYPGMKDDLIKDNVLIKVNLQAPRKPAA